MKGVCARLGAREWNGGGGFISGWVPSHSGHLEPEEGQARRPRVKEAARDHSPPPRHPLSRPAGRGPNARTLVWRASRRRKAEAARPREWGPV